jgi:hypothetical protein
MNQSGYNTYIHGTVTIKLPVYKQNYLIQTKMSYFKNGEHKGKTGVVWGWYQCGVREGCSERV